ncbi:hypothetical protein TU94_29420 [Streptomyces cyaneogriseus subsp. noncyanogenus]|uniref:Uncharacterized protein n=1 Tax=Streptomyces cyaneogriseus subsp. noncyanogenus TaxID=477245 RepID=A0A0C5G866_9ACTN|nr:hypothetical protein TU94_29420 [Streptomyces cyaneogriseus subsp. noncyanogenus]
MSLLGLPLGRLLDQIPLWHRALDRAGVPGELRSDYTAAARVVARRYPAGYPGARLALPPAWQPHICAVGAVAIHTDCLVDVPVDQCDPQAFHAWAEQIRQGLVTGRAEQPILRAALHTVNACSIDHAEVHACLAGQAGRLGMRGYATEQDHNDNTDRSNMPLIRILSAVCGVPMHPRNELAVRLTADAAQRWDDLADLADDLRDGLLTIPRPICCGSTSPAPTWRPGATPPRCGTCWHTPAPRPARPSTPPRPHSTRPIRRSSTSAVLSW